MSQKHAATKQELKLWDGQPVADALPHKFTDTNFDVADLDFRCGECGAKLDNNQVRGTVSNLIAKVLDLNVIGKCPKCMTLTSFKIRIHSNRTCKWYNNESNKWEQFYVYPPNRSGVKDALKDLIKAAKARFI